MKRSRVLFSALLLASGTVRARDFRCPSRKEYWLGRALLGVGKTPEAAFALYRALRAEERLPSPDTALLGSIRLWLGKTSDLLGKREAAIEWYRAVADSPGLPSDKEEAFRYLAVPFDGDPAPASTPLAELRTMLRELAALEDAYWEEHRVYADDLVALGWSPLRGCGLGSTWWRRARATWPRRGARTPSTSAGCVRVGARALEIVAW